MLDPKKPQNKHHPLKRIAAAAFIVLILIAPICLFYIASKETVPNWLSLVSSIALASAILSMLLLALRNLVKKLFTTKDKS